MDAIPIPLRLLLVLLALGAAVAFQAWMFLWHGWHYFREMRRELRRQPTCISCGAAPTRPGAGFCGKCGGRIQRAA